MTAKHAAKPSPALPPNVLASDCAPPKWKSKAKLAHDVGEYGSLRFYNVTGFGWCLATLPISAGRNGRAERTYATRVSDGSTVRVGNGPHVVDTVTVYVKESRREALKKYTDMYTAGSGTAGQIRDRISTRRAQGVLARSRWDI